MNFRDRVRGMGLIEVTIAIALALVVAAGVAKLLNTAFKSANLASGTAEFNAVADTIRGALKDTAFCHQALYNAETPRGVAFFSPTAAITASKTINEIRIGSNPIVQKNLAIGNLTNMDVALVEADSARRTNTATTATFFTQLTISASAGRRVGTRPLQRQFFLDVTTTTVPGPNQHRITRCNLISSPVPTSTGSGGYTMLTQHSFTTSAPSCPAGWDRLWIGYSFAGATSTDKNGPIDLGEPGACLETFKTIPIMECGITHGTNACKYTTPLDSSLWLITSARATQATRDAGNITGANIPPLISRCAVCGKSTTLVARHSFSAAVPACPAGWTSLYAGYSFAGATADWNAMTTPYLLSRPGSCLQTFISLPFVECRNDFCAYYTGADWALWLSFQATSPFEIGPYSGAALTALISRCAVCEKD